MNLRPHNAKNVGFTLVELSIVLVILGLLIGGVLTGQSLIRAAELRSVSTEYARYTTAMQTFRDKYFSLPGDMTNATLYWGKDNTNCSGDTGAAATPGTCNGNGDGATSGSFTPYAEQFRLWQHLALAGLIEGTYTGLAGAAGVGDSIIGSNVPRSKLGNGGWSIDNYTNLPSGSINEFAYNYGNILVFGGYASNNQTIGKLLMPEETFNIDTKMDDGKPGRGKVIAYWASGCSTGSGTTLDAEYRLSVTSKECAILIKEAF